jgi:hypothetical protein
MSDDLPTPRSTLQSGLCVLVRCTACRHRDYADLQALVDSGRGDVPLIRRRYRCGSRSLSLSLEQKMTARPIPTRHWRSYDSDPLPTPAEAALGLSVLVPALTCDRFGKDSLVNEAHTSAKQAGAFRRSRERPLSFVKPCSR